VGLGAAVAQCGVELVDLLAEVGDLLLELVVKESKVIDPEYFRKF
jgi:hypothetical protein